MGYRETARNRGPPHRAFLCRGANDSLDHALVGELVGLSTAAFAGAVPILPVREFLPNGLDESLSSCEPVVYG